MMKIASLLLLLFGAFPTVTSLRWGSFQRDRCTPDKDGVRQYSSRLWDIEGSWEDACKKTPATINLGNHTFHFPAPDRCVNMGSYGMWGEFDVPDRTCDPKFQPFRPRYCRGDGKYLYSSQLMDIRGSWEKTCDYMIKRVDTIVDKHGQENPVDPASGKCVNHFGMWAEFDLYDPECVVNRTLTNLEIEKARKFVGISTNDYSCKLSAYEHWTTDGCSSPLTDDTAIYYNHLFSPACAFHDYCYAVPFDLLGKDGKTTCDLYFVSFMDTICANSNLNTPQQLACGIASKAYGAAVTVGGHAAYKNAQNASTTTLQCKKTPKASMEDL
jgi:hypothetical protein